MSTIIKFNAEYSEGDIVYVKTDPDQFPHVVVGYSYSDKTVKYMVSLYNTVIGFLGIELSGEPVELTSEQSEIE